MARLNRLLFLGVFSGLSLTGIACMVLGVG
jgi:hypothetical protein